MGLVVREMKGSKNTWINRVYPFEDAETTAENPPGILPERASFPIRTDAVETVLSVMMSLPVVEFHADVTRCGRRGGILGIAGWVSINFEINSQAVLQQRFTDFPAPPT
jgi:hypothetical protein